jgi:hypothetical protein
MHRPLLFLGTLTLGVSCAAHTARSDARRAWLDVTLDDPVQPARVVAFLQSYDPTMVGERAVVPPTVAEAHTWLDAHRTESRHWIAEVVQANERFGPRDLPQATLDELSTQLVGVVLEMGPVRQEQPGWPATANPYPWPTADAELRAAMFGLYLQTGRLCPSATQPLEGCVVQQADTEQNLPWILAAQLLVKDPNLAHAIQRPAEHEALEALR